MGDFNVRRIKDAADRAKMYASALEDIRVFEQMIEGDYLATGLPKIGAEQELCLVDYNYDPTKTALDILDDINDDHYTNELALFNLEINLDPLSLANDCFGQTEKSLLELIKKGRVVTEQHQNHLLLTGILPTLKYRHLQFEYMTPIKRYQTLSKVLAELRGAEFEIYLQGVDDFIQSLGTVLFEACNTSFQLHLQMHPATFVDQYNWSQMIAGPVLSACVNSPFVFGKELWAENRIAIFKQSMDTRSSKKYLRKKMPRVYFGDNWLYGSPANLWKDTIMRFPLLVTSDNFESSEATLNAGQKPHLRAIQLHNGTTYTWNRLCYGKGGEKPHIRIECRYLPAGPSPVDEIANFAFWVGLMSAAPDSWSAQWKTIDFRIVKENFLKAARYGLQTIINWFGKNYSAKALILDTLLPMAAAGLSKYNLASEDITKYLSIIENRVHSEQTGSEWLVQNYRTIQTSHSKPTALSILTQQSIEYQKKNIPVHEWDNASSNTIFTFNNNQNEAIKVEERMTTDLFTIHEEESILLAAQLIEWNNIHHLPVENNHGDLVGMLTNGLIERYQKNGKNHPEGFVQDIMIRDVISVQGGDSINSAKQLMQQHQLSGIPVTYKKKLIGILTNVDIK